MDKIDQKIEAAAAPHTPHREPRSHSAPRSRSAFRGKSFSRRDTPTIKNTVRKTEDIIPPIEGDNIRVIPLGGVEEIGRNMTMIEYKNDIIVIDIGFQFKDEDTPGIDYILPNTKYLEDNKHKIRGLFITHGHLDHIGGLPFLIDRIGYPKIYTRQFGAIMIQNGVC
jgi:ribonuclease J